MRIIRSFVVAAYVVVFLALPVQAGASGLGAGPFGGSSVSALVWLLVPALGGAGAVAVMDRRRRMTVRG